MKVEIGYHVDTRLDVAFVEAESLASALCEFVETHNVASKHVVYVRNTGYLCGQIHS
jgi:hypothetical protein